MNKCLFYLSLTLFEVFSVNFQILSIREIKSASEFNSIYNNTRPSIIMFSSPSCVPCKSIEQNLNIISPRHNNIEFYKVDTSKKEFNSIVSKFNIRGLPTLIYLKQSKEYLRDRKGEMTIAELEQSIKTFSNKANLIKYSCQKSNSSKTKKPKTIRKKSCRSCR